MKLTSLSSSSALVIVLAVSSAACSSSSSPSERQAGASSQAVSANGGTCAERPRDFEGDKAKDLIQALIFAGVTPVDHAGNEFYTDTYHLDSLSCQDAHAFDDGITRYDCQSPDIKQDAMAKVLFDAIYGLGIYGDAGLGHTFADVSGVTCKLEVTDGNGDKYTCNVTGTWADECQ